MNHYISDHPNFASNKINDGVKLKVNEKFMEQLKDEGMSERLAYHFAALFVHDPLIIYNGHIEYNEALTDHFENLNSTNWNSVRFKPPPSLESSIGWRVEFRTLDIQITDFENAAFIALLNMMVKVLNDFEIDVSLPISLNDINMDRAHERDAVLQKKFWFRKNVVNLDSDYTKNKAKTNHWMNSVDLSAKEPSADDFVEMSVLDILIGNETIGNTGLYTLIKEYMDIHEFDQEAKDYYNTMIGFLIKRASGEIKTGARFMRDFVLNHKDYKKDSIVQSNICYDLVKETAILGMCDKWDESLLGQVPENIELPQN